MDQNKKTFIKKYKLKRQINEIYLKENQDWEILYMEKNRKMEKWRKN